MKHRQTSSLIVCFKAHYEELLRFLARRTGDAERAADIAQDTYVRLATASQPASGISNPRAYVFRVARNLAIDSLRKEGKIEGRSTTIEGTDPIHDPLASPERTLLARERLELLDEALAALRPKVRQALLMSRVKHLTFAQIAEELGVSESMVAKYIAQALRACRDHLRRCDDEC